MISSVAAVASVVHSPPLFDQETEAEGELCMPNESLANLEAMLKHLLEPKQTELGNLIKDYPCLFSDTPSRTHLIEHNIDVGGAPTAFLPYVSRQA